MDGEIYTLGNGKFKIITDDGAFTVFTWIDDQHEMAVCNTCGAAVPCGWETGDWTPEHATWHAKQ